MKESIKERARQLGFDACRVTSADPPASSPHFLRWLDSGQHGQMAYLARNAQKRVEPNRVLAGAKSVLSLAASYATLASFALGAGKAGSSQIESTVPRSENAKAKERTSRLGLSPATPAMLTITTSWPGR
jgi:epoxyqueuosine reductase QueG